MPRQSRAVTVSTAHMSQRPNTSAGRIANRPLERPDFSKRVSRDDLALALEKPSRDHTGYHVPTRGQAASLDRGLRSSSLGQVSTARVSTDFCKDNEEMGVIAIGMALGSPSAPGDRSEPRSRQQRAMAEVTEAFGSPDESLGKQPRSRKWSLFRSKSKKNQAADVSRFMKDYSNTSTSSLSSRTGGQPGAFPTTSRYPVEQPARPHARHKPLLMRSQTDPDRIVPREAGTSTEARPPLPSPTETRKLKETKMGGLTRKVSLKALRGDSQVKKAAREAAWEAAELMPTLPKPVGPAPSLLDVTIPSIKMERYSVMFNGVLQPQKTSSSSLLARRQATLNRLKTVEDEFEPGEKETLSRPPCRATSPQPKASPSLLHPSEGAAFVAQPTPRSRANTHPAAVSPSYNSIFEEHSAPGTRMIKEVSRARVAQVSTEPQREQRSASKTSSLENVGLVSQLNKPNSQSAHTTKKRSLSPRKTTTRMPSPESTGVSVSVPRSKSRSHFTPGGSSLILDSPESSDDEYSTHAAVQHPVFVEPQWNTVSPPASIESSSPRTSRKRTPPALVIPPEQSTVAIAPPASTPDSLREAVASSIARQINSSYQQHQMLHPLRSNPSIHIEGNVSPAGLNIAVGRNERIAETKTATPTLVHPEDLAASSLQYWHMNRKSSMVVVEGDP